MAYDTRRGCISVQITIFSTTGYQLAQLVDGQHLHACIFVGVELNEGTFCRQAVCDVHCVKVI